MAEPKPTRGFISESTIARMAGNIFAGIAEKAYTSDGENHMIRWAVSVARGIATEVRATEPPKEEE